MAENLHLEIVSPLKVVFKGEINSVTAPGTLGSFQILRNHAALVSTLETGIVKIKQAEGNEILFAISSGILEVKNNNVNILADSIESKEEIDKDRALEAKRRAEELLNADDSTVNKNEVKRSLKRAVNRLKTAE